MMLWKHLLSFLFICIFCHALVFTTIFSYYLHHFDYFLFIFKIWVCLLRSYYFLIKNSIDLHFRGDKLQLGSISTLVNKSVKSITSFSFSFKAIHLSESTKRQRIFIVERVCPSACALKNDIFCWHNCVNSAIAWILIISFCCKLDIFLVDFLISLNRCFFQTPSMCIAFTAKSLYSDSDQLVFVVDKFLILLYFCR